MIIYQITAIVREDLVESFEEYMTDEHMPDVVATGFFESAEMTSAEDCHYIIKYRARTREMLGTYLETRADGLRKDFSSKFPVGVEVERDIIEDGEEEVGTQ